MKRRTLEKYKSEKDSSEKGYLKKGRNRARTVLKGYFWKRTNLKIKRSKYEKEPSGNDNSKKDISGQMIILKRPIQKTGKYEKE